MSEEKNSVEIVQWVLSRKVIKVQAEDAEEALQRVHEGNGIEVSRHDKILQSHPASGPVTEAPLLARTQKALAQFQKRNS